MNIKAYSPWKLCALDELVDVGLYIVRKFSFNIRRVYFVIEERNHSLVIRHFAGFMNMVTHYPSAAISCTEVAPNAAEVSQVTTGDARYAYSDTAAHVLKNIHIVSEQMYVHWFYVVNKTILCKLL